VPNELVELSIGPAGPVTAAYYNGTPTVDSIDVKQKQLLQLQYTHSNEAN